MHCECIIYWPTVETGRRGMTEAGWPKPAAMDEDAFPYEGPPEWRDRLLEALRGVVDPEVGLAIVDLGLVYGVALDDRHCGVQLTMTSAACPLGDLIVADAQAALAGVLPEGVTIAVDLVWDPPWTPDRMSERARRIMGW